MYAGVQKKQVLLLHSFADAHAYKVLGTDALVPALGSHTAAASIGCSGWRNYMIHDLQ